MVRMVRMMRVAKQPRYAQYDFPIQKKKTPFIGVVYVYIYTVFVAELFFLPELLFCPLRLNSALRLFWHYIYIYI